MRVYLDACCLSRLTDYKSSVRICEEAEAVELVFDLFRVGIVKLISSEALLDEVRRNPFDDRRIEAEELLSLVDETVAFSPQLLRRAKELSALGYGEYDAYHLASAEIGGADVLLSTDDKFIKLASKRIGCPLVSVLNPVYWRKEHGS